MSRKILIGVAALAGVAGVALWQMGRRSPVPAEQPSQQAQIPDGIGSMRHSLLALTSGPVETASVQRAVARMETLPAPQRAETLGEFLDTQRDARLNAKFVVGPDGRLLSAPTLRVALLDASESLAPDGGVSFAETILRESTSADEWAVALRILGRRGTTDVQKTLFAEKTRELLRTTTWLTAPTVGFLQAFDAAVFTRDAGLLRELAALVGVQQRREVRWAAFIAADRLTQVDARSAAVFLNAHTEAFADQPELRAGLYARLDVRSPEHRAALEAYLARTDLTAEERGFFAALFPNHNATWSNNLLTPNLARPLTEMMVVDRASSLAIAEWRRDSRFRAWTDVLHQAESRLAEHLAAVAR